MLNTHISWPIHSLSPSINLKINCATLQSKKLISHSILEITIKLKFPMARLGRFSIAIIGVLIIPYGGNKKGI